MFDKIEYKLLISGYMTKDEYKNLIDKYMNELNIPYINAQQYIHIKQKKKFEHDNNKKYYQALLDTYNDIVENGYNISML
jgi:wyosine [tRNA(Phe)-imidazoG37] synthetase (radical SAM superfamily)